MHVINFLKPNTHLCKATRRRNNNPGASLMPPSSYSSRVPTLLSSRFLLPFVYFCKWNHTTQPLLRLASYAQHYKTHPSVPYFILIYSSALLYIFPLCHYAIYSFLMGAQAVFGSHKQCCFEHFLHGSFEGHIYIFLLGIYPGVDLLGHRIWISSS